MSGSGINREPVKVVIINTQYVETDAMSFKSVVQSLTGKDSTVTPPPSGSKKQKSSQVQGGGRGNLVYPRGLSFKDLDRLLAELPPLDDIYRFCLD